MSSRKRKTLSLKRVTTSTKSPVFGAQRYPGQVSMLNVIEDLDEEQMMALEEKKQTKVDRFWGQDKDRFDRQVEKLLMVEEEKLSRITENFYKTEELHQQWDMQERSQRTYQKNMQLNYKQHERENYIKLITTSSVSSDEVINTIWNANNINHQRPSPFGNNSLHEMTNSSLASYQESSMTMGGNPQFNSSILTGASSTKHSTGTAGGGGAGSLTGPIHMSIHLDGLQQSRAIIDKASYSFKSTLRRLNTNSNDVEDATQPFKTAPVKEEPVKGKINSFLEKTVKSLENESLGGGQSTAAIWETIQQQQSQHSDVTDGHPLHKWDQEEMLLAVFKLLDADAKGYLVLEDVAHIASSKEIHDILKFTVFWSVVKRKNWVFFEKMFEKAAVAHKNNHYFISESLFNSTPSPSISYTNNNKQVLAPLGKQPSSGSVNTTGSTITLTYGDWIAAAELLAKEHRVRARHIRTNEEHLSLSAAAADRTKPYSFRRHALDNVDIQREAYLSRALNVGDCVWGLHAKGCVWLPAVIESIHTNYDTAQDDHAYSSIYSSQSSVVQRDSYFSYDIWYPINQRELNQSRAMSASRALLSLPSAQDASLLHPKAIQGERNICAYAFDIIDHNSSGVVELMRLVACFMAPEFRKIIHTSLALHTIFGNPKLSTQLSSEDSVTSKVSPRGGKSLPSLSVNRFPGQLQNDSVYLMEQSSMASQELEQINSHNTANAYSILDKATIPCLLPVFIDTFTAKREATPPAVPAASKSATASNVSTKPKPKKRLSMEQEDANLRELLLLHGHLPAEIATICTRTSVDFHVGEHNPDSASDHNHSSHNNHNNQSEDSQQVERDQSVSSIDWISKLDFLEFCAATVEIIQYSII